MKYVTSFERDAMEEGFEKGIEQGIEQGFVQGKELGVVEGRIEVARKLMTNGFSAEQAASIADVPVALLQSS